MTRRAVAPHPYTDRQERNLCDRCDRYQGDKAHQQYREADREIWERLYGWKVSEVRSIAQWAGVSVPRVMAVLQAAHDLRWSAEQDAKGLP